MLAALARTLYPATDRNRNSCIANIRLLLIGHKLKTAGIIVTFQANEDSIFKLINSIIPQVDLLYIINNGDYESLPEKVFNFNLDVFCLDDNFGIATAQNFGIRKAIDAGSEFVVLFDQDSLPAPDMVAELHRAHKLAETQGAKIAAVGPSYVDPRQGEVAPFVYRSGLTLERRILDECQKILETDFLIASGCLIPCSVLREVGVMQDDLFIDYVDIEWGLRAKAKGYVCIGAVKAVMKHSLGDKWIEFRGRRIPSHSPLRHYYHIRNAIWLAKQAWIESAWKIILVRRVMLQFVFFTMFGDERGQNARMMAIGVWHGIIGRTGKF